MNKYKYNGNKLSCHECEHRPRIDLNNKLTRYTSCPNIDHDKMRFYEQVFNGYSGSISSSHICDKFQVAKWNRSCQNSFTDIEDYIKYLDYEWYDSLPNSKIKSKIRETDAGLCVICVGGFDVYGEIHYTVTLHDWLTGNWFVDNKIKYFYKYKVIRTNKGIPKKREFINKKGIDDLTQYLETRDCKYLL